MSFFNVSEKFEKLMVILNPLKPMFSSYRNQPINLADFYMR